MADKIALLNADQIIGFFTGLSMSIFYMFMLRKMIKRRDDFLKGFKGNSHKPALRNYYITYYL